MIKALGAHFNNNPAVKIISASFANAERRLGCGFTSADVKITVTDGNTSALAGQKGTYTIVVSNSGPRDAIGAVVSNNFPVSFTGVTFTATQSGGASGFSAAGTGNINHTVTLPTGSHIAYKAKGTISSSAPGTLANTATVAAPSAIPDPNLINNSATDSDQL